MLSRRAYSLVVLSEAKDLCSSLRVNRAKRPIISLKINAAVLRGVYPERSRRAQDDINSGYRLLPATSAST